MSKGRSKKTAKKPASAGSTVKNTAKKTVPDEKPLAGEKPLADKKPSTNKKPAPKKEPSANKEPSADKKPSANKKTTAKKTVETKQQPKELLLTEELPQPTTGTETVQPNTKKQGSGLSLFAILLSLIALGVSGYHYYDNKLKTLEAQNELSVSVSQIGGEVTRISDSFTRLQADQANIVSQDQLDNKIAQANSGFEKQVSDLTNNQTQLTESISSINEELRKGANQYVLDEVSQLLRLGNNSAIFSGDVTSAVYAFTLADIQLKELDNPRYSVVRRKINEEIELLKSIKQIDAENVLAQLSSISSKVPSLPLENEPPVSEVSDESSSSNEDKEAITLRSELSKMWSDVINSVSIQRVDQPPKPLLAPKERYFLNQNLQLQLAKAEIALLQNRQALYQTSLAEASSWLSGYFDLDNNEVQEALKQLTELQGQSLNTELPAVSGSYDLLQTIKGGQ